MYPKIELHVHLEGTVRPATLLEIARRNDYALPADTVEGLASLYEYRDFEHFIEVWILTTNALQTADDFRQVVVDYAAEAAAHGAVYLEGIFSPAERVARGVDWDEIFAGYCDGAQEAEELHGVTVRLTPDIYRGATDEAAENVVRYSSAYRERGVVGVGLGGLEAQFPPEPYAPVFELAKSEGLGSVPHAGEVAGPGVDSRCAGRAAGRSHQARNPRRRGSGAPRRARGAADRPRRLAGVERPHGRSRLARRAPAAEARRGRSPAARSRPTTLRCSTRTSRATTRPLARSGSTPAPRSRPAWPARSATTPTRDRLRELGNSFDWAKVPEAELV